MAMLVNLNGVILFLTLILNLGLGLFIYFKDRKNEINWAFSTFLFSIVFWILSFLVFQVSRAPEWVLFLRRLIPVGSSLICAFFLYFSLVFPKEASPLPAWIKYTILLPGAVFSLLSVFTDLMVKDFVITNPQYLFLGKVIFGPAYRVFAVYFVGFFFAALLNLALKYFRASGREKLQLFYVLFGSGVAGVFGIVLSLILPMLGVSQLFTTGPLFTLFLAGFITYAIVVHRLLNIEDFLTRGVYYILGVLVIVGFFTLLSMGLIRFLPFFYIGIFNLVLAAMVYFQNRRSGINLSFGSIIFIFAVWAVAIGMFLESKSVEDMFFWSRIYYVAGVLVPSTILYFSVVFPPESPILTRFQKFLVFLPALLLLPVTFFTKGIVAEFFIRGDGFWARVGWAYSFYFFFYFFFVLFGIYFLFKKYSNSQGTERIRIKYLFWGFAILAPFVTIYNMFLPWLGNYNLIWVGPYVSLVPTVLISYAIVKHRLMSIEVIIQRSTVYAIATILIMALYAVAVIISETFFRKILGYTSLVITAAAALLIAIVYQPLVKNFQNLTDRFFFRGRYDYQKTLRKISHEIASVIKLEELTRLISISFIKIMKISEISFLLPEREGEHFRSLSLNIPRYKKIEIDVKSPIVAWLSAARDILVLDEIEDEITHQEAQGREGETRKRNLEEVRDAMERLGISVWVPIVSKKELIGIIALGNKLSGDIFTSEDLTLLTTLANQIAVTLDNARLYNEVLSMKNYSEEILQSMTNGVLTTDIQGRIVTYNFMAERITGRKFNEVAGKTCEEIWGRRGAITTAVERTLKDRPRLNFETSLASPERGLVPVSLSSTLLKDSQGKKMGALLSIQDLSEIKELEDKIRRADKLTALATMAAGMAHEIKNPLSSMKVFAQLLPQKIDDAEYRKKLNEILPREIDRIDRIVESLLGFARSTTPTFEKIKIEEVLEENLKYGEDKARNAGVKIKKSYSDLPEIEVDRIQISQVFSNLILNGIQAMPEGGELTVSTFPGKKVDGVLQTLKIKISDTGHGISEEMQKKLFDPFFTTKYGGTGLGLTIAHSIVDGHKGFIDVESKVGKGTSFTVTLPLSQGLV